MLLFSDVHLREESEAIVLGEVLPGIRKAALELKETELVCLGDLFHLRYRISVRLQNGLRDELLRWQADGLDLRILPGNHDQIDVRGRNALEIFDEMTNVKVYSSPQWDLDGLWIPYQSSREALHKALSMPIPNKSYRKVAFVHYGVRGAMMNSRHVDTDGVEVSAFAAFSAVLCGHYHKRQKVGTNVFYVGSPWQTRADEAGQDKGFALWDGSKLTYVNRSWGPKFHRFELGAGEQLDLDGVQVGDDVRVTIKQGGDLEGASKALVAAGIKQHSVTPTVELGAARLDVCEGAGLIEYAQAYVDAAATKLNKVRLMRAFHYLTAPPDKASSYENP